MKGAEWVIARWTVILKLPLLSLRSWSYQGDVLNSFEQLAWNLLLLFDRPETVAKAFVLLCARFQIRPLGCNLFMIWARTLWQEMIVNQVHVIIIRMRNRPGPGDLILDIFNLHLASLVPIPKSPPLEGVGPGAPRIPYRISAPASMST